MAGQPVQTFRNGDVLEGRGILAGFKLAVSDLWPE